MLGTKENKTEDQAPAPAAKKGEAKPIKKEKLEQQKDGSIEQHLAVGDVVKMTEFESKMDEKTKKEVLSPKKEQFEGHFIVKEVSGGKVVLEQKDFK